ncbi:MAG TPA: GRP family sugar transporter [bacterium]|nr:GRP family sugar transporter [bacterium]
MGYLFVTGAFLCIGSYMVPVRFATAKGLGFIPFMGVGLLLFDLARSGSLARLAAHPTWMGACLVSGILWVAGQFLANMTLEEVSLAKSSVLFNVNSFINIGFGLLAFHEASDLRSYLFLSAGGLVLFAGAWYVAGIAPAPSKEGNLRKGVLYGLLTGFFWGLYFMPVKAVQTWRPEADLGSMDILAGLAFGGTLPALLLFLKVPKGLFTARNFAMGLLSAFLWAGGTAFFLLAIESLGLSRAVPIVNTSGLVYSLWSLFVFKEFPLSVWPKVLGGALIVAIGAVLTACSG